MRLPIILDTDPGIDDAAAIAAASSIPGSVSRIIGKRMVFSQKKCQTLSLASSHTAG